MNIKTSVKALFRPVLTLAGFTYDSYRNFRFGGWRKNLHKQNEVEYVLSKAYHSLEKSLSFPSNDIDRGWDAAYSLANLLVKTKGFDNNIHYLSALKVLQMFIEIKQNSIKLVGFKEKYDDLINTVVKVDWDVGAIQYFSNEKDFLSMQSPEDFFYSRFSAREFKDVIIDKQEIERTIKLAIKSPSACNRQPWSVDVVQDKATLNSILNIQTGNSGFTNEISNLFIVKSDISAFISGNERYQHWIDGGMFSMSLVYALHSIGLASCCLNWSKMIRDDLELRKLLKLEPRQTIIMLIAFGYEKDEYKVCASPRKHLDSFITYR